MRLKIARSFRSSIPWLISSTQRNGETMCACMAIRKRMVETERSPPDLQYNNDDEMQKLEQTEWSKGGILALKKILTALEPTRLEPLLPLEN